MTSSQLCATKLYGSVLRKHIRNKKGSRVIVKSHSAKSFETDGFVGTGVGDPQGFGPGSSILYNSNFVELLW